MIERAIVLADGLENAHLYFLHVDLLHKSKGVSQIDLCQSVERTVGPIDTASYHVRSAFLLEEAILYEAVQIDADYVIIGKSTKARWRQVIANRLDMDVDLETFLREHLDAELVVQ
jgi:hypothetical protein